MILVKVENDEIVKFPYTINDLRSENPNVSFPTIPSNEVLNAYSVYKVYHHPYPEYDKRTHYVKIAQLPTLVDNVWTMYHELIAKTPEEIQEYDTVILNDLRTKILAQIDDKTNQLITYGFVFMGKNIRLTLEDQHNYDGEYNLIKAFIEDGIPESMIFPIYFKVWTNTDGSPVFFVMNNLVEMRNLISAGKMYIKDCLVRGWDIKNTIPTLTLNELKVWVDPRN